ncbi:hypothetical protein Ahy_A02g008026 [Arachis hypogaea]|uniref:Uncharacterized protein n=1 Tax=Arachis hypogaea TaxID=3818 RepID=A0A445EDM4_ARAHY|nr:hypothetical protein Ahy_A02g008026 [Arachis hypogaea]
MSFQINLFMIEKKGNDIHLRGSILSRSYTTYESIRTINGITYPNFQDAFYFMELLFQINLFMIKKKGNDIHLRESILSRSYTTYESIRTINGITYPNFQDAFYFMELLCDDKKFIATINEVWLSIEKTICDTIDI